MNITLLTSSKKHPVNSWLEKWVIENSESHKIDLFYRKDQLVGGDILFLISCSEIVPKTIRDKFKNTLIIHASDLPKGRGWSPHIWEIIHGAEQITLSLLEANDDVDTGNIWNKVRIDIPKTALYNEINQLIFRAELKLLDFAVENFENVQPQIQDEAEGVTYWKKREPINSELDINKSINEQFNLIRVCDPNRFPAYFYIDGRKIYLTISPIDEK